MLAKRRSSFPVPGPPFHLASPALRFPLSVLMSSSKSSSTAWYDTPLYYDMVYADYTKKETRFIEGIARRHGPKVAGPLRVLEPACGSGRLLESLAARGHAVAGFDLNRHQLAYAKDRLKQKGLKAKVWRDRLEGFRVPKTPAFDVVHCFVSTFKYVLTERGAVSALRRMAKALKPGGRLVFVEYRGEEKWVPIKPLHKMTEEQVKREMALHPLEWVETLRVLPRQHILIFRKPE